MMFADPRVENHGSKGQNQGISMSPPFCICPPNLVIDHFGSGRRRLKTSPPSSYQSPREQGGGSSGVPSSLPLIPPCSRSVAKQGE